MNNSRSHRDPLSMPIGLCLAALILLGWELASRNSTNLRLLVSSPTLVIIHVKDHISQVLESLWTTGVEAGIGLLAALVAAIVIAIVFYIWPRLSAIAYPWLVATQVIPFVAIAPAIILLFGPTGPWGKAFLSGLIAFFPILSNIVAGFQTVRRESVEMMELLHAGKLWTLRYVVYPHAIHYLFAGLYIAAPLSVIGAIVAEFNGADSGAGRDIFIAAKRLEPEVMVIGIASGALLAAGFYGVISLVERSLGPWYWKD